MFKIKRVLCFFLTLILMLNAVGITPNPLIKDIPSYAASVTFEGVTWTATIVGGYAENAVITNCSGVSENTINVPRAISGSLVKSLGSITANTNSLTKTSLPSSVKVIDASDCISLETINPYLMYNAHGMTLYLPDSVKYIGAHIFDSALNANLYCKNPNITFEGIDTTHPTFKYHGAFFSGGRDFFTASKFVKDESLPTAIRMDLLLNADSYAPAQRSGSGLLYDSAYVFAGSKAQVEPYAAMCKLLTVPTRPYHDFKGYYIGNTQIYDADGNLNASNVSTLGGTPMAKWEPANTTLHFDKGAKDANLPSSLTDKTAKYGSSISIPADKPTRIGYDFMGWALSENAEVTYRSGDNITMRGDTTLYAIWQETRYTIIYKAGDGRGSDITDTVGYAQLSASDLRECSFTNEGYSFMGWALSPTAEKKYYTGAEILSDLSTTTIELYATWSRGKYTIVYHNGDETITDEATFNYTFYLQTVDKTGYDFKGWSKSVTATSLDFPKETSYKDVAGNNLKIDLYAVFAPHTYTIKFMPYDSKDQGEMKDITLNFGDKRILPANAYIRKGHKFLGWAKERVQTTGNMSDKVIFTDQQEVQNLTSIDKGTVILFPVWSIEKYSISYDFNAGNDNVGWSVDADKVPTEYIYGDRIILPTLIRNGYQFVTWVDENGNAVSEIKTTDTKDYKLKATWTERGYFFSFLSKGAIAADVDGIELLRNGKDVSANNFKAGTVLKTLSIEVSSAITYAGCKVATSEGVIITETGTYKNGILTIDLKNHQIKSNINVFIYGSARSYNITYLLDGGHFTKEDYPKVYTFGEKMDLPTCVEKEESSFLGWVDINGVSMKEITEITSGDLTLRAIYGNGTYVATIDTSGGSVDDPDFINGVKTVTYKFGSGDILLPQIVKKSGFDFTGWYNATTSSFVDRIDSDVADNQVIYARFSNNANFGTLIDKIVNKNKGQAVPLGNTNDKCGYYYYKQLSEIQKRIYSSLYQVYKYSGEDYVQQSEVYLISGDCLTYNDVMHACACLIKEHPEMYWIRGFLSSEVSSDGQTYRVAISPQLAYSEVVVASDAKKYKNNYDSVFKALKKYKNKSDYEKVKAVNAFIADRYSYSNLTKILGAKTSNDTRSVGSFLADKEGCCEAYSKLTMLLLRDLGINCVTVSSSDHMWNEVKINGRWYTLDTTWNDNGHSADSDYLAKAQNVYKDSHHKRLNYSYLKKSADGKTVAEDAFGVFTPPSLSKKNFGVGKSGNVTYSVNGNGYSVTNTSAKSVTIKSSVLITGYKANVTKLASGCISKKTKTVTIKANLTNISKKAFKHMSSGKVKVLLSGSKKKKVISLIKKSGISKKIKIS